MVKLKKSTYLAGQKPALKAIVDDLLEDFPYVSLLGTDVRGQAYVVNSYQTQLKPSPDEERGFVVRVMQDTGFSEYSFNQVDVEAVTKKVRQIAQEDRARFLKSSKPLPYQEEPKDEAWTLDYQGEVENLPEDDDPEAILSQLKTWHDQGKANHPDLSLLVLSLQVNQVDKVFLSKNKDLSQTYCYSIANAVAMGTGTTGNKQDFLSASGLAGSEIMEALPDLVEKVCKRTEDLLDSDRLEPGEYDIICDPSFTGLIAHEAFGHGTEMDMYVKHRAKGEEYMDKKVGAPILNMRDGAKSVEEVSSYLFDDEGNPAGDTQVIKDGVLVSGMCDELSSLQLHYPTTGNGKRESYKRKAYCRMTNTFFEGRGDKLEDMIQSIDHGYLLEGAHSGMEDPKNWGIQCVANKGREIKDGKLTGKVVSPVYLTGYVPDLLDSISAMSDGLEMSGSGYCGKGWKEWVKVSTGGTYIQCKGRLS